MRRPVAWRRYLVIVCTVVIAALLVMAAMVRHYTGASSIERRLSRELGPDYHVSIESSHYDLLTRTFYATGVSVVADSLRRDQGSSPTRRRTQSSITVPSAWAKGVDLWALRRGDFDIDEIQIDKPEVRVFLDRKVPGSHHGPRRMPHEVLMSTDKKVRIGTARIVKGDIQYKVRAIDGTRPGTVRFGEFYATVTNFQNFSHPEPCVIDVQTRLAEPGLLKVTFNYDLSSKPMKMDYRAGMGRMNASALNDLLVNLKGVRITSGTIDSLAADIEVNGDIARGTVRIPYHGLEWELLDKNSGKQDLKDELIMLLYSGKVRDSNPDDDDPLIVIDVRRQREPQISFLKFVWETVRQGMLLTVGMPGR